MTTTPSQVVDVGELEKMAADIGAQGAAGDSDTHKMLKGIGTGVLALLALVKGKGKPADEPDGDEPDGDEPDGDEPDGDQPDGKPAGDAPAEGEPGFRDMRMGGETEEYLDVTELVQELATSMKAARADNKALRKAVRVQGEQIQALSLALASTLTPMAKAMAATQEILAAGAAPVGTPPRRSAAAEERLSVVRKSLDEQTEGAGLTKQQLSKALASNVIDEDDVRHFKANGAFQTNSEELIAKIKAL